jgi:hypothetical protein
MTEKPSDTADQAEDFSSRYAEYLEFALGRAMIAPRQAVRHRPAYQAELWTRLSSGPAGSASDRSEYGSENS